MSMSAVVLFFAVWSIFGVIGFAIGEAKSRGGAGFWLSFLFGPLGLIATILLPPNKESIDQENIAARRSKQCPACLSVIPYAATKCAHCATEQDMEALAAKEERKHQEHQQKLEEWRAANNDGDSIVLVFAFALVILVAIVFAY